MDEIVLLPWDSDFFGLRTGKLDLQNGDLVALPLVLDKSLKSGYELLYVMGPDEFSIDDATLSKWGGQFVDCRVDYKMALLTDEAKNAESVSLSNPDIRITQRAKVAADGDLKQLAVLSGNLSRFVKDTRLDPSKAKRLFEIWIEKSALGENGERVFLATGSKDKTLGFATIGLMGDHARIGLIAVNPENQGQGVGRLLIAALKEFAFGQGQREVRVATQQDNVAAKQLYSKAGFVADRVQKTYHFLLR